MRARYVLIALAVLVAGCGKPVEQGLPPHSEVLSLSTPAVPVEDGPEGTDAVTESVPPKSVRIPKIEAKSSLVGLGLAEDGTVEVPPVTQPMQASWFTGGPVPGDLGPSVILGHVDGDSRPGIFHRLKELAPGDEVLVDRTDGSTARFLVSRVDRVAKKEFPTEAVYGDTDAAELRLITCGGSFDEAARSYRDNVIVYATLA